MLVSKSSQFNGLHFEANLGSDKGYYYPSTKEIHIGLHHMDQVTTFAHESVHAVEDLFGFNSEKKVQKMLAEMPKERSFYDLIGTTLPENMCDEFEHQVRTPLRDEARTWVICS